MTRPADLRLVPPRLLRAIPLLTARRAALRALNAGLKRRPVPFEIETPFGFRFAGNTGDVIQRYIYVFGVWEPDVTAWVSRNVSPGSVAVDVGANVGYFTLLMARLVGSDGQVHSIEALPSTVRHLRHNVAINSWTDKVIIHDVACSDLQGTTEVFRAKSIGNSSTQRVGRSEGVVRSDTLDHLLRDVDPASISCIKIDTEGDEERVVRGGRGILESLREGAFVVVEITPEMLESRGSKSGDVFDLFRSLGYDAYAMENDYAPARYADDRVTEPQPLGAPPSEARDVLFVRRGR